MLGAMKWLSTGSYKSLEIKFMEANSDVIREFFFDKSKIWVEIDMQWFICQWEKRLESRLEEPNPLGFEI